MTSSEKKKIAAQLGKLGGMETLRKHGKKRMKEWGKLGGRPRKKKSRRNK